MKTKLYILTISLLTITSFIKANSCEYLTYENTSIIPHATINNITSVSKTLVKTFALNGQSKVIVDLDGKIEVKEWNEKTMRVHMNISLQNSTPHMLKYLISQGRYQLNLQHEEEAVSINSITQTKKVIISKKGDLLEEIISYTIFVPKHTTVINKSSMDLNLANK